MRRSKNSLLISILLHAVILAVVLMVFRHAIFYGKTTHSTSIEQAYLVVKTTVSAKPQQILQPLPVQPSKIQQIAQRPLRLARAAPAPSATPALPSAGTMPPLASNQIQQLLLLIAGDIQHHLHYPSGAITQVEQGQSVVQFRLDSEGNLQNIQLVQSSGVLSLDQAALQAIVASSPISIPAEIKPREALILRLPVHFDMENPTRQNLF